MFWMWLWCGRRLCSLSALCSGTGLGQCAETNRILPETHKQTVELGFKGIKKSLTALPDVFADLCTGLELNPGVRNYNLTRVTDGFAFPVIRCYYNSF